MKTPTDINELTNFIINGIEENLTLDYKAAEALQNTDSKRKEIGKDVSAMANSAGGIIIYGIKEFDEKDKSHLPERITPINRKEFSKEQLEQIINSNISPKIEGIIIYPIPLEQVDEVVYVVEIPKSDTAHQTLKDCKYYKRYNFESTPMYDYEIRDVFNRQKHPKIDLGFEIEKHTYKVEKTFQFNRSPSEMYDIITKYTLNVFPINNGSIYAKYINFYVLVPESIVNLKEVEYMNKPHVGIIEFYGENTYRDVVDVQYNHFSGNIAKYGPSRFDPVLPGLKGRATGLKLVKEPMFDEREITWTVYADNATLRTGSIKLSDIQIIERNEN